MVPRLPIPNRTVKRLSADDSVVLPCESRSLPNTYSKPLTDVGGFYFYPIFYSYLYLKLVIAVPCLLALVIAVPCLLAMADCSRVEIGGCDDSAAGKCDG